MKKHLFGFAIFGFIFASFAVAFAYFYAPPIPQIGEVKQSPVYLSEPRTSCFKKSENRKSLKHEIISSQYFYDENKVVSEIKLTWNGYGSAPEKINVVTILTASEYSKSGRNSTLQEFQNPFADSRIATIKVVSRILEAEKLDKGTNLYAFFRISGVNFNYDDFDGNANLKEPTQVVFVHGNSSIIKK